MRGHLTTHYRATIDRERAVEAAPESSREALRGMLEESAVDDVYEIDVWIDADGLVRRQVMEVTAMDIRQTLTFETYDYGAPVNIVVPTDSIIEFPDWLARIREMKPDTNQVPG